MFATRLARSGAPTHFGSMVEKRRATARSTPSRDPDYDGSSDPRPVPATMADAEPASPEMQGSQRDTRRWIAVNLVRTLGEASAADLKRAGVSGQYLASLVGRRVLRRVRFGWYAEADPNRTENE